MDGSVDKMCPLTGKPCTTECAWCRIDPQTRKYDCLIAFIAYKKVPLV